LSGILHHIQGNPWAEVFEILRDGFGESNPGRPFTLWKWDQSIGCDEEDWNNFKTLIRGLTAFDPNTRLTAEAALDHSWFDGV
jgi:hypothetical protein